MRRGFLLVSVVMALLPATAQATVITGPTQRTTQIERWLTHSHLPTPDVEVSVEDRDCYEYGGSSCAWRDSDTIYLSPEDGRKEFFHELGHFFDYTVLSDASRARFLRIMGDDREWISPPNSPHEQFAVVYRYLALRGKRHARQAHLAYLTVVRDPLALRRLIRGAWANRR